MLTGHVITQGDIYREPNKGKLQTLKVGTSIKGDWIKGDWMHLLEPRAGWFEVQKLSYTNESEPPIPDPEPPSPSSPVVQITRVEGSVDGLPFVWTPDDN